MRPIRTPDDLKGLKIRTMENPAHMAMVKALGASPTPIAWGEVYMALQQGVVDGQENPVSVIQVAKFNEVQKYLTLDGHVYSIPPILMNDKFFSSLSPDVQKIITDTAKILVNCAITTSIIMLIIGTANVTLWFLATQQVPQKVSGLFLSISHNPYILMLIVNLILLIVGCFMETGAAIILFAPILAPILTGVGFHPLHVGFIFVFNLVIGMITPPLGVWPLRGLYDCENLS